MGPADRAARVVVLVADVADSPAHPVDQEGLAPVSRWAYLRFRLARLPLLLLVSCV